MNYDLRRLILLAGTRRDSITLRPQHVNLDDEVRLARIVLMPLRVWQSHNSRIMAAYRSALAVAKMTSDSNEELSASILAASAEGLAVTVSAEALVSEWLLEFSRRHARRFASLVRSSAKVDVFPFIDIAANQTSLNAFQRRMVSLISDTNETIRKDVSEIVWRGVINQTPARKVGKEIAERMNIARNRANFIASDQANKVNAFLTEVRQEEAGIDEFMWETAKDSRVRREHAELQGKVYKWKKPPSVGLPGTPPRCRCTGAAHINLKR